MSEEHVLGVLWRPEAIVEEIPVQRVGSSIGMAGRTTLPMLETDRGVMKEEFSFADVRHWNRILKRDRSRSEALFAFEIDNCKRIRKIFRDVGLVPHHRQTARSLPFERDSSANPNKKSEIVGDLIGFLIGGEFFVQSHKIDQTEFMSPGMTDQKVFSIRRAGDSPRVGGSLIDVV